MHTHITAVARRCVPTFVDVEQQFNDTFFNFSITDPNVEQNLVSSNPGNNDTLNFREISINDILDGSL